MAGRVDEVDLHTLPVDRNILGQNSDAPFALQIIGIQNAITGELTGSVLTALTEQTIDERCLAVIDVGDDRNVTDVGTADGCGSFVGSRRVVVGRSEHGKRKTGLFWKPAQGGQGLKVG